MQTIKREEGKLFTITWFIPIRAIEFEPKTIVPKTSALPKACKGKDKYYFRILRTQTNLKEVL